MLITTFWCVVGVNIVIFVLLMRLHARNIMLASRLESADEIVIAMSKYIEVVDQIASPYRDLLAAHRANMVIKLNIYVYSSQKDIFYAEDSEAPPD